MAEPNNKKTKLLIITLIAIIILLLVGIVYEFVVIKNLESKLIIEPLVKKQNFQQLLINRI